MLPKVSKNLLKDKAHKITTCILVSTVCWSTNAIADINATTFIQKKSNCEMPLTFDPSKDPVPNKPHHGCSHNSHASHVSSSFYNYDESISTLK